MSLIHSKRLGISAIELSHCLENEHRPHIRRRLRALRLLLAGAPLERAAKAANIDKPVFEVWLWLLRNGGSAALLRDDEQLNRLRPPETDRGEIGRLFPYGFSKAQVELLRRQIGEALERSEDLRVRRRLVAVDRVLAGENRKDVAEEMWISAAAIRSWFALIRKEGVEALRTEERD
jgi:Helix-turn-helix domain